MEHTLPLESMTIEEKITIMESLWEDLCKDQKQFSSPGWHESVLKEREQQLKNGNDSFIDWQEAKKKIHDSI
ncbi:MAG: addiction module protein [Spirochaetales bacterium]|nr:addiction module protein [Spirochaetales bacterium]